MCCQLGQIKNIFVWLKLIKVIKVLEQRDLNLSTLTLSQTTNLRLFQTEEFADDNFNFDENGRKFSKQIENTVGKGEIARYKQFLLFPQCFQRHVLQTCKIQGLFGKELSIQIRNGFHGFLILGQDDDCFN